MAPSKSRINVVWFKCTDLRTHDHAALRAAHSEGLPVVHLFVFDPFWHAGRTRLCGFPKTGPVRTRFQLEAVTDLSDRLAAEGHSLSTRTGTATAACFEELCEDYYINAVFAFREICSEELRVERQVRNVLRKRGQGSLHLFWGFELYHHDDLRFDPSSARAPFNSYTAFRKRVEEGSRVRSSRFEQPVFRSGSDAAVHWARSDTTMPSVRDLMGSTYDASIDPGPEKDPRAEFRWRGGETAALQRVKEYLWDEDCLGYDYVGATMTMDPAKSCMRDKAMSKLSPWLAHGCLSPRLLYEEVQRYERERTKNKSTYWIVHELLWRDFVRFGSIQAGTSIFKIGGLKDGHPSWPWSRDQTHLQAWMGGRTGFPFVDCFMRELQTTGYCNHMGRECSGWFLIGDLGIDWRMGAEWFESVLVDYEPTANWFNWTYRCLPAIGRGGAHGFLEDKPGQRLQGLEILKWGTQHDPDAAYIKRWLPELGPLPATIAREPWRLGLNRGSQAHAGNDRPGDVRPSPTGRFQVNKETLAAVISMGFEQSEAAIALYRTWEDPEAAVALLLAERDEADHQDAGEEDDLQRAISLSLQDAESNKHIDGAASDDDVKVVSAIEAPARWRSNVGGAASADVGGSSYGSFRYGYDYPQPIIQPVSLMGTEEAEETARGAQAKHDRLTAQTKRQRRGSTEPRGAHFRGGFDKSRWEESKHRWSSQTPTAASGPRRPDHPGPEWREAGRHSDRGLPDGSNKCESGDRKRRWQEKCGRKIVEETARGG